MTASCCAGTCQRAVQSEGARGRDVSAGERCREALMLSVMREFGRRVRCDSVAPRTLSSGNGIQQLSSRPQREMHSAHLVRKPLSSGVAKSGRFLASDPAGVTTGVTLSTDAGKGALAVLVDMQIQCSLIAEDGIHHDPRLGEGSNA
jgi:hypothetical protein